MSFKEFSTAQDAPAKDTSGDKSKDAPIADQPSAPPAAPPVTVPADLTHAPKS